MDKQIDVEKLRFALAGMTRGEALAIAAAAGLRGPTVEKFRLKRIKEMKHTKLVALSNALSKRRTPTTDKAGA